MIICEQVYINAKASNALLLTTLNYITYAVYINLLNLPLVLLPIVGELALKLKIQQFNPLIPQSSQPRRVSAIGTNRPTRTNSTTYPRRAMLDKADSPPSLRQRKVEFVKGSNNSSSSSMNSMMMSRRKWFLMHMIFNIKKLHKTLSLNFNNTS